MAFNFMINTNCNAKCEFCFAKSFVNHKPLEMTQSDFRYLLGFFKDSKLKTITLMGGEPSLSKNFISFVNQALSEDFELMILTNGIWTSQIKKFIESLPKDRITLCFNINKYSNPTLQRKSIQNAKSSSKNSILSVNVDSPDFDFGFYQKILEETGIRRIRWSFALPSENNKFMSITDQKKAMSGLISFFKILLGSKIEIIPDHLTTFCLFNKSQLHFLAENGIKLKTICKPIIDILPDLQVINCFPLSGRVKSVNLKTFANPEELFNYFSHINSKLVKKSLSSKCRRCDMFSRNLCNGGCLAYRLV